MTDETKNSICYREADQFKYQLMESYSCTVSIKPEKDIATADGWVTLSKDGLLSYKKGYSWDGPSGPTIDTKNFLRGSLGHDGLYQLMREGLLDVKLYRQPADEELRKICREDGMSWVRAHCVYRGVRLCGRSSAKPRALPINRYAP